MISIIQVVLILMLLKLLQAKQSHIINQIFNSKALVVNRENNHKYIYKQMAKGGYTHIFTSLKIVLSTKFKKNIFDYSKLTDRLYLLPIDEIHLVDQ